MQKQKRILICPLDWGLGHATRVIPIIRLLIQKGAEVIIAAEERPLQLLRQEFPDLEFIRLKGYNINYSEKYSMVLKMLFSIPTILNGILKEHNELKKIIKEKSIDIVISDNRFGLWNKNIRSVFITHQLMIKTPFGEELLHFINLYFIKKFDECWVPDNKGENNMSGDLAHKYSLPENGFYIGILSRFNENQVSGIRYHNGYQSSGIRYQVSTPFEVLAIISGPEPQRSIFEKIVLKQLKESQLKVLVVCGKTEAEEKIEPIGNIEMRNHLNAKEMQDAILNSKIIIARSGYSTIMDLAVLGKKAIFIPTPGQTEQEYLAETLMKKKIAYSQKQSEFNLLSALIEAENYRGFEKTGGNEVLKKRIEWLLTTETWRSRSCTEKISVPSMFSVSPWFFVWVTFSV